MKSLSVNLASFLLAGMMMFVGVSCSDDDKEKVTEMTGIEFVGDDVILWEGSAAPKDVLAVAIQPPDASTDALLAMVQWSSNNPSVVAIANGVFTVVGSGVATVTASLMGETAFVNVYVPVASLTTQEGTVNLRLSGTGQASVIWDAGGDVEQLDLTAGGVTCSRSFTAAATRTVYVAGGEGLKSVTFSGNEATAAQVNPLSKLTYLNCADNQLNAAALTAVIGGLPGYPANSGTGTINLGDNPGASAIDESAVTGKGWQFETDDLPEIIVSPNPASVEQGQSQMFTAVLSTEPDRGLTSDEVEWTVSKDGNSNTFIDANGMLHVMSEEAATTVTVTATLKSDGRVSGTATVTVTASVLPTLAVTPNPVNMQRGESKMFTAVLSTAPDTELTSMDVDWTVSGKVGNTNTYIDARGSLTIAPDETATTLTVTATLISDERVSGTATVTILKPTITVSPATASVQKGGEQEFEAILTNADYLPQEIEWSLPDKESSTNTYVRSGLLAVMLDETATTLTVRAALAFDKSIFGEAKVTITDPPAPSVTSVTVSPKTATVEKGGQSQQFVATVVVTGGASQEVTWSLHTATGQPYNNPNSANIHDGLLSVMATETNTTLIVRATAVDDNSKWDEATVTITNPPAPAVISVTVSPETATVTRGGNPFQFTATVVVTGGASQEVNWSVTGNANPGTTINANGQLTVTPNEPPTTTTLTVRATAVDDNSKWDEATVTIN